MKFTRHAPMAAVAGGTAPKLTNLNYALIPLNASVDAPAGKATCVQRKESAYHKKNARVSRMVMPKKSLVSMT